MSTVIRIILLYGLIVVGLRVLGRRELSQMSPLDLVTLLLVPEIASQAMLDEDFSVTNAVVALATLFTLVFISTLLRFHYRGINRLIEGTPTVLVHEGVMYARNMELERVSEGEVFAEMHKAGVTRLEQIEWVILQTDGHLAVVPKISDRQSSPPEENGPI